METLIKKSDDDDDDDDDGIDLYFSRCMSDPNFMALALTIPKKHG